MSISYHGPMHDPLNNIGECIPYDGDPPRMSVVSCLVPASVAIAAR